MKNHHMIIMGIIAGVIVVGFFFTGSGSDKLLPLILLLCPLSMIAMMWFMGKNNHKH